MAGGAEGFHVEADVKTTQSLGHNFLPMKNHTRFEPTRTSKQTEQTEAMLLDEDIILRLKDSPAPPKDEKWNGVSPGFDACRRRHNSGALGEKLLHQHSFSLFPTYTVLYC